MYLTHYTFSAAGPATPVITLDNPNDRTLPFVLGPGEKDLNATFECTLNNESIIWKVEEYCLIDRDEFSSQGLTVLDRKQGHSKMVLASPTDMEKGGFQFLFDSFERCFVTISCFALTNHVVVNVTSSSLSQTTIASCHCSKLKYLYTVGGVHFCQIMHAGKCVHLQMAPRSDHHAGTDHHAGISSNTHKLPWCGVHALYCYLGYNFV